MAIFVQVPNEAPRQRTYEALGPAFSGTEAVSAAEALDRAGGFPVRSEPLYINTGLEVPARALLSGNKVLSVVSPKYQLVTPAETVEMWDTLVQRSLDGFYVPANKKRMVMVTRLPEYDVAGDQVENFLYLVNSFTGTQAMMGVVSAVRIYCTNQLPGIWAAAKAGTLFRRFRDVSRRGRMPHRMLEGEHARDRLRGWLSEVIPHAEEETALMRDVYKHLAQQRVSRIEAIDVLAKVYPVQPRPQNQAEEIQETWHTHYNLVHHYRNEALAYFEGAGEAMDRPAVAGTAFGLVNAITEYEDRRPSLRGGTATALNSALFGARMVVKDRALQALLN